MSPGKKPPRALRRLFPLVPRGEMAREDFDRGMANELAEDSFPGMHGPFVEHFERERRQLDGDPLLDGFEEPDDEDDYDPADHEEP